MSTKAIHCTLLFVSVTVFALVLGAQQQRARRRQPPKPATAEQVQKQLPPGVKFVPDVAYREGNEKWKLDLYLPDRPVENPRPGIVFVHGGGWSGGDKRIGQWWQQPAEYASKGYVVISVNYRFVTEVPMPACIEDVKCAVRWFRANAAKYEVDPERLGGYGNSAGAHLVSMLGLAGKDAGLEGDGPYQEHSSLLQAVCAAATPADFPGWNSDKKIPASQPMRSLGAMDDTYAERARKSSPITYVRADAPPFLLIHGTADNTVPIAQAERFAKALRDAGAKVSLMIFDQESHGVFVRQGTLTRPAMEAFFASTIGRPE
jgi:acetyl esterase/lipase